MVVKMEISFTKVSLPYGWLGNMAPYPAYYDGYRYFTSEHAFQASRLPIDHPVIEEIKHIKSPMGAKMRVKKFIDDFIVEPLSKQDLLNMKNIVLSKFTDPMHDLDRQLVLTGNSTLIEDVTKRANKGAAMFWGAKKLDDGTWEGDNNLGLILMETRDIIRKDTSLSFV